MQLSQLIGKPLYQSTTYKGVCKSIGITLKTGLCKYAFCASNPNQDTDFALSFSCLQTTDIHAIQLSACRPVSVKQHTRLSLGLPVFSSDGKHLGNVQDAEIVDYTLVSIITNTQLTVPLTDVYAISDAVILQKSKPYPIGQRIPAPFVKQLDITNKPLVTRSVLQSALRSQSLIKLTLSLSPFSFNVD